MKNEPKHAPIAPSGKKKKNMTHTNRNDKKTHTSTRKLRPLSPNFCSSGARHLSQEPDAALTLSLGLLFLSVR